MAIPMGGRGRDLFASLCVVMFLAACGGGDDAPPASDGVDSTDTTTDATDSTDQTDGTEGPDVVESPSGCALRTTTGRLSWGLR